MRRALTRAPVHSRPTRTQSDEEKTIPALVAANTPFAEAFMSMARTIKLVMENGDGDVDFAKVGVYVKVANAIRACTVELESRKQIAKMKRDKEQKLLVAGIGDSAGKAVEEIRETGKSTRLEELRGELAKLTGGDGDGDGDGDGGFGSGGVKAEH